MPGVMAATSLLTAHFILSLSLPARRTGRKNNSERIFKAFRQLVVPAHPESSLFLLHPLAAEAGGDAFHSGGRQFASYDDADFVTLVDWVRAGAPHSKEPPVASSGFA